MLQGNTVAEVAGIGTMYYVDLDEDEASEPGRFLVRWACGSAAAVIRRNLPWREAMALVTEAVATDLEGEGMAAGQVPVPVGQS